MRKSCRQEFVRHVYLAGCSPGWRSKAEPCPHQLQAWLAQLQRPYNVLHCSSTGQSYGFVGCLSTYAVSQDICVSHSFTWLGAAGSTGLEAKSGEPVAHGQYLTSVLRSQESGSKEHPVDFFLKVYPHRNLNLYLMIIIVGKGCSSNQMGRVSSLLRLPAFCCLKLLCSLLLWAQEL